MSAIAGLLERGGGPGDPAIVGRMLAAMGRRGADAVALHAAPPILLGHGLLRTARADLHVARDGSAVSFDGRLDARETLAGRLGIDSARGEAQGDAALVLAAYRRWGPACANELLGDFAYALWDAPARRLVCTRDRFGVRPLTYAQAQGRILFASEPKALIAGGAAAIDEAQVADMLAGIAAPPERTLYRDIRRLPPAHSLIVDEGALRIERYWTLPLPEPRPRPDAPAEFHALLPQDVLLMHDTIAANLRIACIDASPDQLWTALEQANAAAFVRRLPEGLETIVGERGVRLSGGERQRISLARALLRDPLLLILDEATSALDAENRDLVTRAIAALRGRVTVLLIAHDEAMRAIADHVVTLERGRIVAVQHCTLAC